MSKRINRHAPLLQHLSRAKPSTVKSIIKTADKELINVFCECALNVLRGVVPLTKGQKSRLRRHKKCLRDLVNRKTSRQKKSNILQRGGFLGALLPPIIGILGGLLGN